jgi:hypothetical protein
MAGTVGAAQRWLRRRGARWIVPAALAWAASGAFLAGTAQATTFDFCGTSAQPNWTYLTNTHDRCADGNYHQFIYTRTHLVESGNYACAIVKEYPDGTGHNDTAPQCGQVFGTYPYMYIESPCTTPYSCTGYATITNDDVYAGHYWGFASI